MKSKTVIYEVGDGWKELCDEMVKELQPYIDYDDIRIKQIKENYGELGISCTCFHSYVYDEVVEIVERYMELARNTCSYCGKTGASMRNNYGWNIILCDECQEKGKRKEGYLNEK